jgi:N-acetylglucosamine-6-phosphate deacetylase
VTIRVDDRLITAVEPHADPDADIVLDTGTLTSGLVDIQINGAFGVDFAAADDAAWDSVAAKLPSTGVTSFQPTLITAPLSELLAGLDTATEARDRQEDGPYARILGVHLEGPWLSPRSTACTRPGTSPSRRRRPWTR